MSQIGRVPLVTGDGEWDVVIRTGVRLLVRWLWHDAGQRIDVELQQRAGPGTPRHYAATFSFDPGAQRSETWVFGAGDAPVDATLSLRREHERATPQLWANVPLKPDEFFSDAIAQWKPPAPPPDPPWPPPDDPDDEIFIDALPGAADLLPLLWLRPPSPAELADARLRYMGVPDPSSLPLYVQLAAISGPDAATEKRKQASAFRGTSSFINDLSTQPAPINELPVVRLKLLGVRGTRSLAELREDAYAQLGETVSDFVKSAACTSAWQDGWQSIFTLALVGTAADGRLASELVDMLRVIFYMQMLATETVALCAEAMRRLVLDATPSLPDAVAASPLSGSVDSPKSSAQSSAVNPAVIGEWSLLGVGEVEIARQHLKGYAPGELAEVVNLMPRERQERHERSVQSSEEQIRRNEQHTQSDDRISQNDATNELADTFREAMCTSGLVRNLSNVTPSYSNLNLLLTGTAADGSGKLKMSIDSVARLVQRMSEQASQKVAERMSVQRRHVWREWRERRESQCIDNRDGERLVGVYRWIDRLLRVSLTPRGRRLVLAVQIQSPGAQWKDKVLAQGPVPLVEPQPLDAFDVPDGQGYTLVKPTNYQSSGAQYGLTDLPSPPPNQLVIAAQIDRVTIADHSVLRVPDGYAVASGSATLALANTAFSVVASVGGTTLHADQPTAPGPVVVIVPSASSPSQVGNLTLTPPAPPAAWLGTTVFQSSDAIIGAGGSVPVTVMTDAPIFGLSIELVCERVTITDPTTKQTVDPLFVEWQMCVYARLLHAWQNEMRAYDAAAAARIAAVSAGETGEIQRQVLQNECLALLCASSATADPQALIGFLDWTCMSWHYDSPVAGVGPRVTDTPAAPAVTEPASARLFRRFLDAKLARVLIPLRAETQTQALFALQWQARWPSPPVPRNDGGTDVPVAQSTIVPLEEQRCDDTTVATPRPSWTLRVPLPLIYLQHGDALPSFSLPSSATPTDTP